MAKKKKPTPRKAAMKKKPDARAAVRPSSKVTAKKTSARPDKKVPSQKTIAKRPAKKKPANTMIFKDGSKKIPQQAILLAPVPITKANLKVVVDAKWITKDELCAGVDKAKAPAACK